MSGWVKCDRTSHCIVNFSEDINILSHYRCVVEAGYSMNVASQYGGYSGQPVNSVMFPGQPFISGPVADMAVQYGHTLAGQGTEFVHKNVSTACDKHWLLCINGIIDKK